MKAVLAALAGFSSAMLLFAGGAYSTLLIVTSESGTPRSNTADVAELWTNEPRRVDVSQQRLERAEPLPTERTAAVEPGPATDGVDTATVAAVARTIDRSVAPATAGISGNNDVWIAAAASAGAEAAARDLRMHIAWCTDRYRSYRPEDNTYLSYTGERRDCLSHHMSDNGMTIEATEAVYVQAATEEALPSGIAGDVAYAGFDASHAEDCFARYRSYRPEDNSYQPYGGGPRQQCE